MKKTSKKKRFIFDDSTEITDRNIYKLVEKYTSGRKTVLPEFLQNKNIGDWDVSRVTIMQALFVECPDFNEPLNNWNVSNVVNMENIFYNCKLFDQDLSNWNVSKVETMKYMFYGCESFNRDLSKWNVSNVTNMYCMFTSCKSLTINPGWTINKDTNAQRMFDNTPLQGQVLRRAPYNIREANKDSKNLVDYYNEKLEKRRGKKIPTNISALPEELIDKTLEFFDPYGYTSTVKSRKAPPKESLLLSPGGGYAGGKKRKRTQKRNNRKF